MESFHEYKNEFKKQLGEGDIQKAYQGFMAYFRDLRAHFEKQYPDYTVPEGIYYGYMDMTYFSIVPEWLKRRKLKIAIVFVYNTFRFEVWLSGVNRAIQAEYWKLIKESDGNVYHIASNPRGVDYILDHILVGDPDFSDLDGLTKQIESGALQFIGDVENFLSRIG